MKVMTTRMSLLVLLPAIHLAGGVISEAAPRSSACPDRASSEHCATTSSGNEDDWVSLLQVSASSADPLRQEKRLPDHHDDSVNSHAGLGSRHAELKAKISKARASLAAMEAEVARIEAVRPASQDSSSELTAEVVLPYVLPPIGGVGRSAPKVDTSDGALTNFIARRCPEANQAKNSNKPKVSLLQTAHDFLYPLKDENDENGYGDVGLSWRGMSHFQVPTVESHVSGRKCQTLPQVHNVGGPAALPNILANTVVLYQQAGYEGSKLRDMVSNELSKQLSNGGPWNVVAGIFDWNLYNEATKFCTVAVKFQVDEPDWYSDWIAFGA